MKKLFAILIVLVSLSTGAFAQEALVTTMESHVDVGDFMVNAGINFGWYGLGLGGGVEFILAKFEIPQVAPIHIGGAAKAAVYFTSGIDIDLAALATMHFGLKGFTSLPSFLQNLDWYWGLGMGLGIGSAGGIGISSTTGVCYYLNPLLAINADYFYTNYFGSGSGSSGVVGLRIKL